MNGHVSDLECGRDGGADNFLFSGGIPELLPYFASPEQAAAMRVHPLLYPAN